jgi:galactonate dehydratase
MKVTDLETYLVDTKGLLKWVFVKLTTDEGIVGYGEAGNAFRERAQAAAIQELKPLVVGRDPFAIRSLIALGVTRQDLARVIASSIPRAAA